MAQPFYDGELGSSPQMHGAWDYIDLGEAPDEEPKVEGVTDDLTIEHELDQSALDFAAKLAEHEGSETITDDHRYRGVILAGLAILSVGVAVTRKVRRG